ncbi:hypothetical protein FC14_GL001180 [Ligilactobacillus agilis DSM 20509]|uniref:Flagellar protein FlbD n=1 Tax=Ligilactobacillus agilis DSM 20509 TaxID=1423718 RepID=A0A0R2AJ53_9LACO|nr:hypothetical protein FC14_GL001180 [Ligilactobacillus agilis DSM 20509]
MTSFKGKTFYLNPDLLYRIDETPDTVLTLTDGKNLVVKETASEVVALIITYRQKIYRQPVTNLVEKVGD